MIGGGPAGLTAAIYLARFHLAVKVVDAGDSRASMIVRTHNHAGFPGGISGDALLGRMRAQARSFGVSIETGRVTRLETSGDMFEGEWGEGTVPARSVLLATGVHNRRPSIDESLHQAALKAGLLHYCPVCDGFEVTDRNIAVIGAGEHGMDEAVFLRSFSPKVTLIAPDAPHGFGAEALAKLSACEIAAIDGPCHVARIDGEEIVIDTVRGPLGFDALYPALGSDVNSDLALSIGADVSDAGCILVDAHQRTSVPGVYAAGDVVIGLDQISHAMGKGGVAATAIRNDLAKAAPLLR
ncbi:MAG: NAD(P)/FAD-dependent oxidoreductase [Sphingomonadaceae bacterium]|nr:NAD(P)/FAD-dependent oxidoreductase [Sphingomonadaceae bacterium]